MKCSRNFNKSSGFIQPDYFVKHLKSGRTLANKFSWYFSLGNTNSGGIIFPVAPAATVVDAQ